MSSIRYELSCVLLERVQLWRSPGRGNDYALQYSCLKNPMFRGDWWATVHRITKSQTWLSQTRVRHDCTHTQSLEPSSQKKGLISTACHSHWLNTMLLFCSQSQWWNVFSLHLCCPWWMKSRPLVKLFSYWNYPQEFNRIWNSNSLLSLNNIFNVIYAHSVIFKFCISRITSHSFFPKHNVFFSDFSYIMDLFFFFNTWSYPPLCT